MSSGGGGGGLNIGGGVIGAAVGGMTGGLLGSGAYQKGLGEFSNFYGELSGGNAAARAAQQAAEAQAAAARSAQQQTVFEARRVEDDVMRLAQASPEELRIHAQSLSASDKQLRADEQMLAAIDPGILEASQQALKLLRGEKASMLGPLEAQRSQDRERLVQSLQEQLGPGALSSSVGLKAMRDFDMQTSQMMAGAQQQGLASLLGAAQGFQGLRPDLMRNAANYTNLASVFRNREMTARQNVGGQTLGALAGTQSAVIQSAGAQYTGDLIRAQNQQGLFNSAVQVGGMFAGNYMGAKGLAAGLARQKVASAMQPEAEYSTQATMPRTSPMYSTPVNGGW